MWPFSAGLPEVAFEDVQEKYDYIIVGKILLHVLVYTLKSRLSQVVELRAVCSQIV